MSKLKFQSNVSGTGVITVESPNTDVDRTIVLPDSTGTILMTDGDGSALVNLPASGMEAGTKVAFFQAAAPTGWTQDTSQNDKVLRVVSSAGGGTGGTWATSSGPTHTLSAGAHTLSESEMPSHTHTYAATSSASNSHTPSIPSTTKSTPGPTTATSSTGGGSSHSHSLSGSITAPAYIDMIIATKD